MQKNVIETDLTGKVAVVTGAGCVLFLLNDKAAGFITGIVLPIDGGFSAYGGV